MANNNSHQEELIRDHRLHRALALCRTVTSHLPCAGRNVEEHVHHLADRLAAISRGLLYPAHVDGVDLELLVLEEIRVHAINAHRIAVAGPTVLLVPQAGELMSLVIHELATNALKHGALCQPQAKIRVLWEEVLDAAGARALQFEWQEQGVSLISDAARSPGFGVTLLERLIARELQGEGKMIFRADGVCCTIRIPLIAMRSQGG